MSEGFTITSPDRNRLAAIAAKHGLKAIKIGMRANSSYTPARCRAVAEQFTGKKFKARDYDGMIAAIDAALLPTVAVWSYDRQDFIEHAHCEGEKRVRIDVHDSLTNYAVFEVRLDSGQKPGEAGGMVTVLDDKPLTDWRIDLT